MIAHLAGLGSMGPGMAKSGLAGNCTPHSRVNISPKALGMVVDMVQEARFDAPTAVGKGRGHEEDAAVTKVYPGNVRLALPGKA